MRPQIRVWDNISKMKTAACLFTVIWIAQSLFAQVKLGNPEMAGEPLTVATVLKDAEQHDGKNVKVKGKITEVCQMMGCWIQLVDPESKQGLRVKVVDGEIIFPKDSPGKMAIAEGKLKKIVYSKEQVIAAARHEAEEQGRKFDPSTITDGRTFYMIQGTGAVLLD